MVEDSEGAEKIIVFVSADNFQCHSEAHKILVDGIFQTCPRMFYQVFTIHSFKNQKQFPFACRLLPGKSCAVSLRALELIKEKAEEHGYLQKVVGTSE